MTFTGLSTPRIHIVQAGDTTTVSVPVPRNRAMILTIALALSVWLLGGYLAFMLLRQGEGQDRPETAFVTYWLVGWAVVTILALVFLLWHLFGVEALIASRDRLTFARRIFGLGYDRHFPAERIRNLRWMKDDPSRQLVAGVQRVDLPAIGFEVGKETIVLGHGLSRDEADPAIAALAEQMAPEGRRR